MTLKIEAGKYYHTRDGRKFGPMLVRWPHDPDGDIWGIPDSGRMWNTYGQKHGNHEDDLIAEWPAHIVTHEGREYDLTALETPLGLLPEPVRDALKAWPQGVELFQGNWVFADNPIWAYGTTYRAKPAPVEARITCYRGAMEDRPTEHGTCIKRADGSIDWDTWVPQA